MSLHFMHEQWKAYVLKSVLIDSAPYTLSTITYARKVYAQRSLSTFTSGILYFFRTPVPDYFQ